MTMSEARHFILATAGHVDHGKSALIKALTGTDPDRLPEEKARGITIDLGFAHLELAASDPTQPPFLLGIVDVPGHEDFVKNMVAGVGSIDLALLVVAADDGWMPQTEEHLQILSYLRVNQAAVALTKIDLAQNETSAIAEVREKLRGTRFAGAPIVPTSVVSGRGLEDLKAALASKLAGMPLPADVGKPRLPVDRVFKLQGIGTVVTGTLTGGVLRRGQSMVIQPSGQKARIRSVQSHNRDVDASGPGARTALNLPDLNALEDVRRGDTVTLDSFGAPSQILDAELEISARANRPVKNGTRVRIHHGSGNVAAHLLLHEGRALAPGQRTLGQLRLEAPSFMFAGDRFIVRDWAEQNTLAGGVILEPDSRKEYLSRNEQLQFLKARAQAPDNILSFISSQAGRDVAIRRSELLVKSRFSSEAVANGVSRLAAEGKITLVGNVIVDSTKWRALMRRATELVDTHHQKHPEQIGLSLADLKRGLQSELPIPELFDALVSELSAGDFVRSGAAIRRKTHRSALSGELQSAGAKLRRALVAKPFDPPSRKELAPDPLSQKALRFLIENGEAVEINEDVVISAESLRQATELIHRFLREHGPATVSELRQTLGSSRRVVVPLLERLDRDGITLRRDDRRVLRG